MDFGGVALLILATYGVQKWIWARKGQRGNLLLILTGWPWMTCTHVTQPSSLLMGRLTQVSEVTLGTVDSCFFLYGALSRNKSPNPVLSPLLFFLYNWHLTTFNHGLNCASQWLTCRPSTSARALLFSCIPDCPANSPTSEFNLYLLLSMSQTYPLSHPHKQPSWFLLPINNTLMLLADTFHFLLLWNHT